MPDTPPTQSVVDPKGASAAEREAAIWAAARVLQLDAVAVEVIGALSASGVRSILMKGPSVANWLYNDAERRSYVDVDLLVDPDQVAHAGSVLTERGFDRISDDSAIGWHLYAHAHSWDRRRDGASIDLHWRIPGIASDPRRAWMRLSSNVEHIRVAGTEVESLGIQARTLQLALHAAYHGLETEHPKGDLVRGVARVHEDHWRAAAALAHELDAVEAMAVGLRLLPEGRVLADRLGLPTEVSTRAALWARTPHPWSKRLFEIGATPGAPQKARLLAAGLVPPAPHVRRLFPWARAGGWALGLAYAVRLIAGLRQLPGVFRALWRARVDARRSQDRARLEHRATHSTDTAQHR